MSLVKSKGNMYDWVSHMHTHLGGECSHQCSYCYTQRGVAKLSGKYKGALRLIDKELNVNYGKDKIIFIEHMNDLFADSVPAQWIEKILLHCCQWQDNAYVFQTKNPKRIFDFEDKFPNKFMIGTTIETNRLISDSKAPSPFERYEAMLRLSRKGYKTFITIEPIFDFDVITLSAWIIEINPDFVNIGADSKKCNLPEPSKEKIQDLIQILNKYKIHIKKKINLERILGNQ